jgi:hypothetical protein
MDIIVSYNTVRKIIANPPSLSPCPNFFNIHNIRSHIARALKKIPCPKLVANGCAGAVMSPEMYILMDPNAFHLNIALTTNNNTRLPHQV